MFAQGQEQQVNRYLVALALVAPLIAETVETPSEANLSSRQISLLYKKIHALEEASEKCKLPAAKKVEKAETVGSLTDIVTKEKLNNCDDIEAKIKTGTAFSFESISFEVNKALSDTLKQAFDNLDLRANVEDVLALEPTEILKTILEARHLIPVLMRYLASYRDVSLVFGISVMKSCFDPMTNGIRLGFEDDCKVLGAEYSGLVNRQRATEFDIAKDERPIRDLFLAGKGALNKGLPWSLSKADRASLLQQVDRACRKLDAIARIDDSTFEGCSPFDENSQNVDAQRDVEAIIGNGSADGL